MAPGADQMVGRRLARGIRRARVVGCVFGEAAGRPQAAEHLVGRDMVEAEGSAGGRVEALPIGTRGGQQGEGADDVRVDEGGGAVDRPIDMAFRSQMRDDIGAEVV